MSFGYPGDNFHLENHEVSEESFWPSFTDVMMVISMVFLLVTVTVILNNWALITDLKQSISDQEKASLLVESKSEENENLANVVNELAQQVAIAEDEIKTEEQKLADTILSLESTTLKLEDTTTNFNKAETDILERNNSIKNLQEQVMAQQKSLAASKELADKLIANLAMEAKNRDIQTQKISDLNKLISVKTEEEKALSLAFEEKVNSLDSVNKTLQEKTSALVLAQSALEEKDNILELSQKTQEALNIELEANLKANKVQIAQITDLEKNTLDLQTAISLLQKDRKGSSNEVLLLKKEREQLSIDLDLAKKEKDKQASKVKLLAESDTSMKKILTALQTDRGSVAEKLLKLQGELATAKENKEISESAETKKNEKIEGLLTESKDQLALIKKLELENKRLSGDIINKLSNTEKDLGALKEHSSNLETQLESKNEAITVLQKERTKTETQLLSLKGEFDSLDTKYQKLLRPARSSNGKYIVSVIYKKTRRGTQIRLKSSPDGSYRTINQKELDKTLVKLKEKHKTDLYIKVIIPNDSGLSYNEAWKFTSNLQRRYDYYFQPDKSKKSN